MLNLRSVSSNETDLQDFNLQVMTKKLTATCPSCEKSLDLAGSKQKKTVRCSSCNKTFTIKNSTFSIGSAANAEAIDTAESSKNLTLSNSGGKERRSKTSGMKKLGRFELQSLLGTGGFGKVFRAYDPKLERLVALKVPTFDKNSKRRLQRFLSEAKAAARLKHANIVSTFDSGIADNKYYIALEYIDGEMLSDRIARSPVPIRESVKMIRKLADALAYAHSRGVIHRDIKPENIILDENGEPQLMDFGLAKRADDDRNLTVDGSVLGTPLYMSPEQARGEISRVDEHSDQYSLGVVLFHLLSGETPCSGAFVYVISEVAKGHYYSARKRNSEIDRDLDAICAKAMSPSVEGRYASCSEFAADLLAWFEQRPVLARPLSNREKLARLFHQHKAAVATGAAFVSLLACSTVISLVFALKAMDSETRTKAAQRAERQSASSMKDERDRANAAAKKATVAQQAERQAKLQIEKERDRASKAANDAIASRKLADKAKQDAIGLQQQAEAAKQKAETALQRTNYFLALAYTRERRYPEARKLLETIPEQSRSIEWYAAKNEANHSDATYIGHRGCVTDICCTPDGSNIISAGEDGTIRIWETETTKEIAILEGHVGPVRSLSIGGSGNMLVSGGDDGSIRIWDLRSNMQVDLIRPSPVAMPIQAVSLDSSQQTLVYAEMGKNAYVACWDLEEKGVNWEYEIKYLGSAKKINISQSGNTVALAGYQVELLDLRTGNTRQTLRHQGYDHLAVCSHSGKLIFLGKSIINVDGKSVKKWTIEDGRRPLATGAHPSKNRFAAGFDNGMVRIFDADSEVPTLVRAGHESRITSVCFSPRGSKLFSADIDGVIKCCELDSDDKWLSRSGLSGPPFSLRFAPAGDTFAAADKKGNVSIWDIVTRRQLLRLEAQANVRYEISFSPDGKLIAIPGRRPAHNIEIYEVGSGRTVQTLPGQDRRIRSLCFSPDGKWLASAYQGATNGLIVWDTSAGTEVWRKDASADRLTFWSDGTLATSYFGRVQLRNGATGEAINPQSKAEHARASLCRSRDGTKAVTIRHSGDSSEISVLDCKTGDVLSRFSCPREEKIEFSRDGKRLVSTGSYQQVKIWDWMSGQQLCSFSMHPDSDFALSPNDEWLVFASSENGGRSLQVTDCRRRASQSDAVSGEP